MINEEKAEEIGRKCGRVAMEMCDSNEECTRSALLMAEWKDEQFTDEKSALINRIFREFEFEDFTYSDGYGGLDFDYDKFAKFLDKVADVTITE